MGPGSTRRNALRSSVIAVEGLTKHYGPTVGVERISFDVHYGEIFGFLGPNGAGKTTTIRLLLDLIRPTNGTVEIFDRSVSDDSYEIRRRCGYLPGTFSAYGNMTSEEFLRFAGAMRRTRPIRQKQLLERFGFSRENLTQKIKHLSHGTRQKLGIVQAFFHKPELVILDEPTIGLDPLMQDEFYDLIRDSQREGCTVFFSSHNLPEVEKTCGRVAIIRDGSLVALETLEDLRRRRYRRLHVTLRRPVEGFELEGAELLRQRGLHYEFVVKGGMDPLFKSLSDLPLADVVFPEPDLEEVFMAYYKDKTS
jgi:ABC-2 type transport system ATP-binding protein